MSSFTKAQMVGTWTLVDTASVEAVLVAANNRGQKCFNALAAYGQTTTDTPLAYDDMAQAYILPDVAAVDAVLQAGSIRGQEFMTALLLQSLEPSPTPVEAGLQSTGPNRYLLTGSWLGKRIRVTAKVTDPDGDVDSEVLDWEAPDGEARDVARALAQEVDALPHVTAILTGARVSFIATGDDYTLELTLELV